MIIKKIFNLNAVLAKNTSKQEIVVMGCGIGFKKKVGENIDENLVEKTFILKQKEASEKFKLLLEDVPVEHVSLCYDIIEYAQNILNIKLNDYIYVTLTDHISNALKIFEQGFNTSNVLIWEIKKFYPKEFAVGLKALDFIESEIGNRLPEGEAGNIALHLINAQVNSSGSSVVNMRNITEKIMDVLNIVKYTYNIELDDKSLGYERFVTHLRFFFKRLDEEEKIESELDDFLLKQGQAKYKKAYNCMLKIEKYLQIELSDEEKLYLTLHIQRVTQK
ncbi:PRD domain-containing protein [Clostridium sediminicola]|uniref:BglG family transcription antiterminator LicT n=1 Tax=Clostridium sediminicola TaxID=3114879 RepID=UPI0031F24447